MAWPRLERARARVAELEPAGVSVELVDAIVALAGDTLFDDRPAATALAERAEALAVEIGYERGEGRAILVQCHCGTYLGPFEQIPARALRALDIFERLGDDGGCATALYALGEAEGVLGDATALLDLASVAMPVAQRSGEPLVLAWTLNAVGNGYWNLGDRERATATYGRSLRAFEASGHEVAIGVGSLNYGYGLAQTGRAEQGLPYVLEAVRLAELYVPGDLPALLGQLAEVELELGGSAEAAARYATTLAHPAATCSPMLEAELRSGFAQALLASGDLDGAADEARHSLRISEESGSRESQAAALTTLGECLLHGRQDEEGYRHLQAAADLSEAQGRLRDASRAWTRLARWLETHDRFADALEALRQASRLEDGIRSAGPLLGAARRPVSSTSAAQIVERYRREAGIIPICAHCHSVGNSGDQWHRLEQYLLDAFELHCSHGICPGCLAGVLAEIEGAPAGI